jgi:hypothetical protein
MSVIGPALPVPTNISQEWVSAAFVHAICAQAGLNISKTSDWDDGLDITIASTKAGYCGVKLRNVKFHLQLKSTRNWNIVNGHISFWLKAEKYNDLTGESVDPQHLVLYTLPKGRSNWVRSMATHAVFNHCAYFYSFTNLRSLPAASAGETIHIPIANRLTAGELLRMYREAGKVWQ